MRQHLDDYDWIFRRMCETGGRTLPGNVLYKFQPISEDDQWVTIDIYETLDMPDGC